METLEIILKIFIALVNCFAVSFICIVVTRIYRKMSKKIDAMSEFLLLLDKRMGFHSYRSSLIFLNILHSIKKGLIEAERYEEIAIVNAAIEKEEKQIFEYMEKSNKQEEQEKKQEE